MKMQDVFFPAKANVLLFIVLLAAISVLSIPMQTEQSCGLTPAGTACTPYNPVGIGFPKFYYTGNFGDYSLPVFSAELMIANILVYYIIACLLVVAYRKR